MTASIFDGLKYIYAEQLKGKAVVLTIKSIAPIEIVGDNGRKDIGFEMAFNETPKLYAFSGVTRRRTLASLFGEDYSKYAGQKIKLYPAKSAKSASGLAIQFAAAE